MSRLKIEHGVSRAERVKLQVAIDRTIADDIDLMASWSNNERNYIVGELLRYALAQSADFQRHKQQASVDVAVKPPSAAGSRS